MTNKPEFGAGPKPQKFWNSSRKKFNLLGKLSKVSLGFPSPSHLLSRYRDTESSLLPLSLQATTTQNRFWLLLPLPWLENPLPRVKHCRSNMPLGKTPSPAWSGSDLRKKTFFCEKALSITSGKSCELCYRLGQFSWSKSPTALTWCI